MRLSVLRWIGDPLITRDVLRTLECMAPDPANKPRLVHWLREGYDREVPRVELRTALRALARAIQPRRYLEIGVRRGWSMAQVMAEAPTCRVIGCDPWIADYSGAPNSGEQWVRQELWHVVPYFTGRMTFISGYSQHDLAPVIRDQVFDLICVDGDHTGAGALADLRLCLPKVAREGALVFDDLVNASDVSGGLTLRNAWEMAQAEFEGFAWREYDGLVPVGVAYRV